MHLQILNLHVHRSYMYARSMLFIVGESLSKLKGLDVIQLCAAVCTYMYMLCYVYVESV